MAAELLQKTLHVGLPAFTSAQIDSASFTDLSPPEYRADLVVVLARDTPVLAIIVEIQLGIDDGKRRSWPHYATSTHARLGCPTCVLVVAPTDTVARWAMRVRAHGPGWTFAPLVLGPDLVPVIDSDAEAYANPELAVLSALAHGQRLPPDQAARLATSALRATESQGDPLALLYFDLVIDSLSQAARRAFFEMDIKTYSFKTDFARKFIAEGKAEGMARAVLNVLEARGIGVPVPLSQQILACKDLERLDQWLRRAATVAKATEVFGDSA